MMHTCPNHELSRKNIIQNVYARLSYNDRSILDNSSTGFFVKKTIEFKWCLLERIKRNSTDWEFDKGNESGIKLEFNCVKSSMETNPLSGLFRVSSPEPEEQRDAIQPAELYENIQFEIPSGMIEKLLANPFAGDETLHPDEHLICG